MTSSDPTHLPGYAGQDTGASPLATGLSSPTEPASSLGPTGFDPLRWQPIETAPPLTHVLAFIPRADRPENLPVGQAVVAYKTAHGFVRNDWRYAHGAARGMHAGYPSHWMPLPKNPMMSEVEQETLELLGELHTAMADVMMLRRLSSTPEQRQVAENAIKIWRRVQAHLEPLEKAILARAAESSLAAAAPDLYEALKAVVAIADRKTVEFDRAHAALAKASGIPTRSAETNEDLAPFMGSPVRDSADAQPLDYDAFSDGPNPSLDGVMPGDLHP
jgi:hypothetical protein